MAARQASHQHLEHPLRGQGRLEFDVRGFLPLSRVVVLDAGANPQSDIKLVAEFEDPDAALTMIGRACRRTCKDHEGEHGGIVVRAVAGLNLVAEVSTDEAGFFTIQANGEDHTLTLRGAGFVDRSVEGRFSDERQVFLLDGEPLGARFSKPRLHTGPSGRSPTRRSTNS